MRLSRRNTIRPLSPADLDAVLALERAAWPEPLRASRETVERRFSLGHTLLGSWWENQLTGLGAFVLTDRDPLDEAAFPATFGEYSSVPSSEKPGAAFVYNVGVDPAFRRLDTTRQLLLAIWDMSRDAGCRYLVGDGRCPSYAGSTGDGSREVERIAGFREALDRWRRTGRKPADDELTRDPVLRFYRRLLGCRFLYLKPDFLPADTASGGYRVIFVADL